MMNFSEYIPQALRTKSSHLHLEVASLSDACNILGIAETWGYVVDGIKKGLFYGRPLPSDESAYEAGKKIRESIENAPQPSLDSLHALMGMFTEVAELNAATRSGLASKKIDELGDLCWYIALYCADNNIDFEATLRANIAKLRARFPDKFDAALAIGKDERVEKTALEMALARPIPWGSVPTDHAQ